MKKLVGASKMKHLKYISLSAALALSMNAAAQGYETVDKSMKLAPLKIGGSFTFGGGTTVGGIVQGCVLNKLFYNAEYTKVLIGGIFNGGLVSKENVINNQDINKGYSLAAGVDFALIDKTESPGSRVKKILSSTIGYQSITEKYVMVPCDLRKIFAVGGGVFSELTPYYLGHDTLNYFESHGEKIQPEKDKYYYSNVSSAGLYGGITLKKIKKGYFTNNGQRIRETYCRLTQWNFQALLGYGQMKDLSVNNASYSIDNVKFSPIGYRIMWGADRGPTSTRVELGLMPHIAFTEGKNHSDRTLFGVNEMDKYVNYFKIRFNFILYGKDSRYAVKAKRK